MAQNPSQNHPSWPAEAPPSSSGEDAPPSAYRSSANIELGSNEISLPQLVNHIRSEVFTIIVVVLLLLIGTASYVLTASPTYRSDALLKIGASPLSIPSKLNLADTVMAPHFAAELETLRSRRLLASIVEATGLDIVATPQESVADKIRENLPEGVSQLLFGSEHLRSEQPAIKIGLIEVSESALGEPIEIYYETEGQFRAQAAWLSHSVTGQVGELLALSDERDRYVVKLRIDDLRGEKGSEFVVQQRALQAAVAQLRSRLLVIEKGKDSRIIQLRVSGYSPEQNASILNKLIEAFATERKRRESESLRQRVALIKDQLPQLRKEMLEARAKLNAFLVERGSPDIASEIEEVLELTAKYDQDIARLRLELSELIRTYTREHPKVASVRGRIAQLERERQRQNAEIEGMTANGEDSFALLHDANVASDIYANALSAAQELQIQGAAALDTMVVIDPPVPSLHPTGPRSQILFLIAVILGALLGVAIALLKQAARTTLLSPNELARFGLGPILAILPHAPEAKQLEQVRKRGSESQADLAFESPIQGRFAEEVRSIAASLPYHNPSNGGRVIAVGGPTPLVGKTLISAHLAYFMAQQGAAVLLIDADSRRGKLHQLFAGKAAPGLQELVYNDIEPQSVIQSVTGMTLDLISRGDEKGDISLGVGGLQWRRFQTLIDEAKGKYDIVVIDTPPLLFVSDGLAVAQAADDFLVVVRHGEHRPQELKRMTEKLRQAGANLRGVVYNDQKSELSSGDFGRSYRKYHKAYYQ